MYKNQLQELAQRSCFNLPSYACVREGLDHAPRFKASVNFNGEIFQCPTYYTTLRQAEHAAAEVALCVLSTRGPSRSLTTRVLDETGVYKNLLQETAHRGGLKLPVYTTVRSGPGHAPVFTSTVEIAGLNYTGDSAKTKKQAEKNAAIVAWAALKKLPNFGSLSNCQDGSKQVRWDQNQTRRRMVRGHSHRDNGSNYSLQYQQWRSLDLLLDSASEILTQKQSILASLLSPSLPKTTSKLLPSASSGDVPLLSSTTRPNPIQVQIQEVSPQFEENKRDAKEWISRKLDVIESSLADSSYSPIPLKLSSPVSSMFDHNTQNDQTHIRNRLFGSATPSPRAFSPIKTSSSMCSHMRRTIYNGGCNPQKIAPAVQIRSVIPVCAAPPLPVRPTPPNPPSVKQVASSSATSMSKNVGAVVSSANPMFNNNPESYSTQFSSMFNKKLRL